ncbi:MFS transporter, partial [Acinetobacter baumannii]
GGAVPWLLVLFGIGLVIGNAVGGRLADRSIDGTLLVAVSALLVVLVAFAAFAGSSVATIVALFLMGGFGFATVPALQ